MPRKKKHLPIPPKTPFGRNRLYDESQKDIPLTADRMAEAMANGRIEDFFRSELPQGEHARKLASMMMGMTGMMPPVDTTPANPTSEGKRHQEEVSDEITTEKQVPEEVANAVQSGDVKALMGLLEREHKKRMPEAETGKQEEEKASALSAPEKKVLDSLMKIASENNVSLDWLILRALRVYVDEHRKNGKL